MAADALAVRLLEEALTQFQARGYAAVTPAEIAAAAGCSLDDLYRHFPRKERFIVKLYERLASDLEGRVPELPTGTIARRFAVLLQAKLALLQPHRTLFQSLVPAALDPTNRLAVLGPDADRIRARVQGVFAAAVLGATPAPPAEKVPRLVRFLYALHLGCIFLNMQDQTPDAKLTTESLELAEDVAALGTVFVSRNKPSALGQIMASMAGLPDLGKLSNRVDQLVRSLVQPPHDSSHFTLAENILRNLFRHRRLQPGSDACAKEPCAQCLAMHLPRVQDAIAAGEAIHMVLPAFPAKSANPQKTTGALPDLGEELALRFLQERCDEIARYYPPGARLTICSDGRVFNDLVGVDDDAVSAYRKHLIGMIRRLDLKSLDVFDLDDVRPLEPFASSRAWLVEKYADSLETLTQRTHEFEHHRQMFNGIHRFLTDDLAAREPALSKTQARNQSKDAAHEVIRRSNAWSRLVAGFFPNALRLSIHPQPPHAEKIGILLTPADDAWLTPWHGAVLLKDTHFMLTRRADAEAQGAKLILRDGFPSHYELPVPLSKEGST